MRSESEVRIATDVGLAEAKAKRKEQESKTWYGFMVGQYWEVVVGLIGYQEIRFE